MILVLESLISCPQCGTRAIETMPGDACLFFYRCRGCGDTLRPLPGDCCVFCSYGTVRCPPKQVEEVERGDSARMEAEQGEPSRCWCCGVIDDPARMVHLGDHPEVALCTRCARWAAKQAWEIEDQGKTGPLVLARDRLRVARRNVVEHGWHNGRWLGGPIRWLGKRLP